VAQGEHVGLMFPMIFELGVEIGYAYTSFKWENNARRNAGVTVVVISLRMPSTKQKYIFTEDVAISVESINGYLADAPSVFVYRRSKPLFDWIPRMTLGSMPKDGKNLQLTPEQTRSLEIEASSAKKFLKKYVGAAEFINDIERYCLWIEDEDRDEAERI